MSLQKEIDRAKMLAEIKVRKEHALKNLKIKDKMHVISLRVLRDILDLNEREMNDPERRSQFDMALSYLEGDQGLSKKDEERRQKAQKELNETLQGLFGKTEDTTIYFVSDEVATEKLGCCL